MPIVNQNSNAIGSHWWVAEHLRQALLNLAEELAPYQIELMAFKGVHLAFAIAPNPWFRRFFDADALVVSGSFFQALKILKQSSQWQVHVDHLQSARIVQKSNGACIDLHSEVLPLGLGRLNRNVIAQRMHRHVAFGDRVWVPDAIDAAVIAIGHFVKNRVGAFGHGKLIEDLSVLEKYAQITPDQLAARLENVSLRRAGLVALVRLTQLSSHWDPWLQALQPTQAEYTWAQQWVYWSSQRAATHRAFGFILVRSLGDSWADMLTNLAVGSVMRASTSLLNAFGSSHLQ